MPSPILDILGLAAPFFNLSGATPINIKGLNSARDNAAYPLSEAARYLHLAPTTLGSWVFGRRYPTAKGDGKFHPLIQAADPKRRLLSFNNLVEAHVLRALRTTHGAELKAIRSAISYAERELGIKRLLLSKELLTDRRSVFLDHYGELVNLSHSGQLAMRVMLEAYLQRVDRDNRGLPLRLFPFIGSETGSGSRYVAIDPVIGFGRPIVRSRGISTRVIAERIDAGETVTEVAADYGIAADEVQEAVVYERAA